MIAVACTDVSLSVGRARILREVSLEVACGELVALVGPNGAGKSSVLRVLAGELSPTSGAVSLFERPLGRWADGEIARRRAFLTQRTVLSLPFRVEEVAAMGRAPHDDEDLAIIDAALEAAGVSGFRDRTISTLSGGEAQRVHFARALAQLGTEPRGRLLLLDEPTAALDLEHQHSVLATARALAHRGAAVVLVLHDINLAAQYGDRVIVLRDGAVIADGTPGKVLTPALVRAAFRVDARVFERPDGRPVIATSPLAGDLMASSPV